MNLDDLMAVWRSQDASPLHRVDKTLLHLALRQEEAKLQTERRRERWIAYLMSALFIAFTAFIVIIMLYPYDDDVLTGWDYVIQIVGAAAALVLGGAMYVSHKGQARREQRFGESLRDQLTRRIAQLDDQATRAVSLANVLVTALAGVVCPTAIVLGIWRINEKSFSDDGFLLVVIIIVAAYSSAAAVWQQRRSVQRDLLPRKHRLEALLKELDGQ
jgi:O-antigen/teichoic acid export membrane protein